MDPIFSPSEMEKVKAELDTIAKFKKQEILSFGSDSLGIYASGGVDTSNAASTLTYNLGHRLFLDPYIKMIDKFNNRHSFKNRVISQKWHFRK